MKKQYLGEASAINLYWLLIFPPFVSILPVPQDEFQSNEHMAHPLEKCSVRNLHCSETRHKYHLAVNPSSQREI